MPPVHNDSPSGRIDDNGDALYQVRALLKCTILLVSATPLLRIKITTMTYQYIYRDSTGKVQTKTLTARHILEALHNARFEVMKEGGDIRGLVIKNENAIA